MDVDYLPLLLSRSWRDRANSLRGWIARMPAGPVMSVRLVERNCCGKSWHIHFDYLLAFTFHSACWHGVVGTIWKFSLAALNELPINYVLPSTVIIRRHLGDQERKFLSHIHADKEFLSDISIPVSERENNL